MKTLQSYKNICDKFYLKQLKNNIIKIKKIDILFSKK